MQFLDTLNPEQREAVLHLERTAADSRRRRVRARRASSPAASPISSATATRKPHEVLAVTFTNKAAEEMRARVESLLGSDCTGMWVSTFHSLCARLLRREAPAIGLSRDFVIYDSSDQLTVVKQALKAAAHRRQLRAAARGAVAHQPREEPDGKPRRDGRRGRLEPARRADRQDLRATT